MSDKYQMRLQKVTVTFLGEEERLLNIGLYKDGDCLDYVVLAKEDILWLLGEPD